MATGKDGSREAELEAAIEQIRVEVWRPGQTLPKLRDAIALILQELKGRAWRRSKTRSWSKTSSTERSRSRDRQGA
jgi:hypothetical protein